ncbi:MAG: hypothetical protein M3P39_01550, partial [Actinomycetota bacterium]|nr:hypothetical protein [Actinomycetota bacterium]
TYENPATGVRVRRLTRAVDDGFRSDLIPGIKASADARRLADELAFAAARLAELTVEPPGTYADAALAEDREEGLWLAFLTAWVSPAEGPEPFAAVRAVAVPWSGAELPALRDDLPRGPRAGALDPRTPPGYRAWASRAGGQAAALAGDAAWTAERRFARAFERLALPGLARAARFDFLASAGRLGLAELSPDALHLGGDEPTTLAAKRVFGIGDTLLLERRAADLAAGTGVPLGALDLALFNWGQPAGARRATMGSAAQPSDEQCSTIAGALGLA